MKKSELRTSIREEIIGILSEATPEEIAAQKELNAELEKTKELQDDIMAEEEEPTKSQLKGASKDSVATIARKLQQTAKEMKSTVNKWKSAEGEEKERLLARLKELTKIKKELEGLL